MIDQDTYARPADLSEALRLLASAPYRVAAGCTDLLAATERKVLPGPVLDITGITGLRGIETTADGITLGATTTWRDIIDADLPPAFDGLKLAAREVGAVQIQNRGTIAGNLCNASPAADGVPPLLTLDADVVLESVRGERQIALSQFLTGPRQTARQPDELVTGIHVPARTTRGVSHFLKLGARRYLVISVVMTAARLRFENGVVAEAALAIGACGPVATRLPEAEAALIGTRLDPARIQDAMVTSRLSPIDDVRADAEFRRIAAAELLLRTLAPLAKHEGAA